MNIAKKRKIVKIVLTGGPCSGKTTVLTVLLQVLWDLGFYPIVVPEAATSFFTNGVKPHLYSSKNLLKQFLKYQIWNEEFYADFANSVELDENTVAVMLTDRGTMDPKVYSGDAVFDEVIAEMNLSEIDLRDARYHLVINAVTAAYDAEDCYTLTNNAARTETPEKARSLQDGIDKVWLGTPHYHRIGNAGKTFEQKKKKIIGIVLHALGHPVPIEIERKFILKPKFKVGDIAVPFRAVDVIQDYLVPTFLSEYTEERVRARGIGNSYAYFHTAKMRTSKQVIEMEEIIQSQDYLNLLMRRDARLRTIKKKRHCFLYKDQYFELDVFENGMVMLEAELTEEQQELIMPDFIKVEKEVTDDPRYTNRQLAEHMMQ